MNQLGNLRGYTCDKCGEPAHVIWHHTTLNHVQCPTHEQRPKYAHGVTWDRGTVNRNAVTRMADKYDVPITAMHETTMGQSAW